MAEAGITKNKILSELSRSPHGKLGEYLPIGKQAAKQEAEFLAHLISWNHQKGAIRDSKVALPIVSLSEPSFPHELMENSLAHLALLGPRELDRALRFTYEVKLPTAKRKAVMKVVEQYLREIESDVRRWDRVAVQHRDTLKSLYCLTHTKPFLHGNIILFGRDYEKNKMPYPAGSVFADIARLKDMSPTEAAAVIVDRKIPFLIAMGALGKKAQEPDLVLALINRMSATELVTNTKMLEKLGIKTNPALRGAYEQALEKASKSKKNVLKTTRAAEAIEDEGLKAKLRGVQERQIQSNAGIEGNWLVLADKSGSMHAALEIARHVSAALAKFVKGKVHLVFFDTAPQTMDVTGLPLDKINEMTKYIRASGGTSIGCGLQRMLDAKEDVDGIAIVSDGGENTAPIFPHVYKKYSEFAGKEVPVYLYLCDGDSPELKTTMQAAGIDMQVFDMNRNTDYYSLPNMVATMRTNRYSLIDEVMATKLLKLEDVFKSERREEAISA